MASGGTSPSGPWGANAGSTAYSQPFGVARACPSISGGNGDLASWFPRLLFTLPLSARRPPHLNHSTGDAAGHVRRAPVKPSVTPPGTAAERSQHRSQSGTGRTGAAATAVRGPPVSPHRAARRQHVATGPGWQPCRIGTDSARSRPTPTGRSRPTQHPSALDAKSSSAGSTTRCCSPRLEVMAPPPRDCQQPVTPDRSFPAGARVEPRTLRSGELWGTQSSAVQVGSLRRGVPAVAWTRASGPGGTGGPGGE